MNKNASAALKEANGVAERLADKVPDKGGNQRDAVRLGLRLGLCVLAAVLHQWEASAKYGAGIHPTRDDTP